MTQPAPSALLFNRSCTISVGTPSVGGPTSPGAFSSGISVTNIGQTGGLDIWFQVKRSLKPAEPSTCDLKFWNLADATRQAIESYTTTSFQAGGAPPGSKQGGLNGTSVVPVRIQAGYVGNVSTIFLGEMRSAQTVQSGPDLVTELNTGDSDEATLLARSTRCFGTGCNAYVAALAVMKDMGIGVGNIATVQAILAASPLFSTGGIVKSNSMQALSNIATACGLEVSVQGGLAQWLTAGRPLGGQAYVLSSTTGLIGSPTVDTKGILHAETLMLPGLAPGQPIQVQAKFVSGWFRILSLECTGDTHGEQWGFAVEAGRMQMGPNTPWLAPAP